MTRGDIDCLSFLDRQGDMSRHDDPGVQRLLQPHGMNESRARIFASHLPYKS